MTSATFYPLMIYALVVAVIARTVTQEEVFRELQEYARRPRRKLTQKLLYPLTCQYCFSHWVAAALVLVTGYDVTQAQTTTLKGFVLSVFVLVAVANAFLILYETATVKVRRQRAEITLVEQYTRVYRVDAENKEMVWSEMLKAREEAEVRARLQQVSDEELVEKAQVEKAAQLQAGFYSVPHPKDLD